MLTLVVATNNPGKAREFQEMLAPMGIEVKTLADFPPFPIVEDGNSFEENALKKAQAAVSALNLPVVADDSGLMVDALDGEPGIHSARYAGDHNDAANNQKLLAKLAGVPDEERTAHFHTKAKRRQASRQRPSQWSHSSRINRDERLWLRPALLR